ncbi:MAG: hypothetical protein IJ829_03850 [Kiritimatiellae bacterium]|nr:hypothetical protein [Kiritimatiellia bacterium]
MKYRYLYQTKDNENKEGWIKAKSRENAYAELRKVGVRPYRLIGDDPLVWKPYAALAVIVILATALATALFVERDDRAPRPRAQLVGDRAVINAGVYSSWTNVFSSALDRRLAQYAQPGRYVEPAKPSAEECAAFAAELDVPLRYVAGEPPEHRMVRNIVAKMRGDLRAYLAEGGDVAGYLEFLDERQANELEFRQKALETVYRSPESLRERAWLGVNARLKDMGLEPLARPAGLGE